MAVNLLTSSAFTNTSASNTSASFTPTANSLLIVIMFLHGSGTTDPGNVSCAVASGLSGQGAFTLRKEAQLNSTSVSILTSLTGASPTAGTVTCSWTNSKTRKYMVVLEVTGQHASPIGTDGANTNQLAAGLTITMGATPAAGSTVITAIGVGGSSDPLIGLDAAYTELVEANSGGSSQQCYTMTGYDAASAAQTIDFTNLNTVANCAVALEIVMATAAPGMGITALAGRIKQKFNHLIVRFQLWEECIQQLSKMLPLRQRRISFEFPHRLTQRLSFMDS